MSAQPSTPLPGPPRPIPASSPRMNMSWLDIPALKSFGMLVTGVEEGTLEESPELPESGNCQDWKPSLEDRCRHGAPKVPEARYAYYRRCQKFLRTGEQCKAPAMKGEGICHQHALQADNQRRRDQQRREFLSRPGVGFGSFNAIQVALSELANSLFMGTIDHKVAGRLMMDIQNAIRLQKMLARWSPDHRITRSSPSLCASVEGFLLHSLFLRSQP